MASQASPDAPQLPALDNTFGAYLLGTYGSTALFGITCLQTFMYYRSYPSDRLWIKITVGVLFILETVHVALNIHGTYWFLITNYFKPEMLLKVSWSSMASIFDVLVTALIVHAFYAHRIFNISGGLWWPAITVIVLALAKAGNLFALCVISFQVQYFEKLPEASLKFARPATAFAVATDLFIAACLTYYLRQNRTGKKRTNSLVNKLMVIAINNGLLTCLVEILVLAFIVIYPNTLIYLGVFVLEGNLYTNSLLATLNARKMLREELNRKQMESNLQMTLPTILSDTTDRTRAHPRGIRSTLEFAPTGTTASLRPTQTERDLAPARALKSEVDGDDGLTREMTDSHVDKKAHEL